MRNEKKSKGNYGKVKAAAQPKKKANKLPKPSNHHNVKPKKKKAFTSIKERLRSVGAPTRKGFKGGVSFSRPNVPESIDKSKKKKSKKKNGSKQRRAFQMKISQSNEIFLKRVDVPWYSNNAQANIRAETFRGDADNQDSDDHDIMALLQLPPDSILSNIDSDIASFCAYITLGPVEVKARQAFLDEITGIALNQFGKSCRNNRNSRANDDDEEEISVVPFGSFATQSVCTFASDVDMCLWGVVKGEKEPEHITFVDSDTETSQKDTDVVKEVNQHQRDECPLLTESSLLRTMEAIQTTSPKCTKQSEQKKDTSGSEKKQEDNDNNDLFFIDRVGESIDNGEKQDNVPCEERAIPENKPAPKKGFQFEIDSAGVAQLGGNVDDFGKCKKFGQRKKNESDEVHHTELAKTEQPSDAACEKNDEPQNALPSAGNTKETAIDIDDDGDKSDVIVIDSDDDDDADKLASYYARQSNSSATDNMNNISTSPINLLHEDDSDSDSSCESARLDVDDSADDDSRKLPQEQENEVMELSLTSGKQSQKPVTKPVIGPTGKTRNKVVSVLLSLTNHLRRSSFTHTIECRSRARVPIINCSTRTGFEGDIAIGGHNGTDTSLYAMSQVNRFNSFAPIILVMKVLMNQQGLDKPFTGGLGSYKLYVMVAYHIENHIANGGNDRPSEILISLLFRFGCAGSRYPLGSSGGKLTTDLVHLGNSCQTLTCDGGMCELSTVFRLPDCVDMFRECHERLTDRCLLIDNCSVGAHQCSYLSSIIDCYSLREARETSKRRARLSDNIITRPTPRDHPGKVSAGRRISHVFTRTGSSVASKPDNKKRKNTNESPGYKRSKPDTTKRGPRGGIIPKNRPDLDARKSIGAEAAVIQRGMKQRKNKKKQARDKELTRFASGHSF